MQLVVLALERGTRLCQQPLQHGARFVEAGQPLSDRREWDPVRRVLVLLPSGTHAEDGASPTDVVEGCGHVGDDGGMPVEVAEHECSDPHSRHVHRQAGRQRPRLEDRPVRWEGGWHEVVGHPHAVPTGALGVERDVEDVVPGLIRLRPHTEAHLATLPNADVSATGAIAYDSPRVICRHG